MENKKTMNRGIGGFRRNPHSALLWELFMPGQFTPKVWLKPVGPKPRPNWFFLPDWHYLLLSWLLPAG